MGDWIVRRWCRFIHLVINRTQTIQPMPYLSEHPVERRAAEGEGGVGAGRDEAAGGRGRAHQGRQGEAAGAGNKMKREESVCSFGGRIVTGDRSIHPSIDPSIHVPRSANRSLINATKIKPTTKTDGREAGVPEGGAGWGHEGGQGEEGAHACTHACMHDDAE